MILALILNIARGIMITRNKPEDSADTSTGGMDVRKGIIALIFTSQRRIEMKEGEKIKYQWRWTWLRRRRVRRHLTPEEEVKEENLTRLPGEKSMKEMEEEEAQEATMIGEEDLLQDSQNTLTTEPLEIRSLRCQMCHRETLDFQEVQEILQHPPLHQDKLILQPQTNTTLPHLQLPDLITLLNPPTLQSTLLLEQTPETLLISSSQTQFLFSNLFQHYPKMKEERLIGLT